MHKYICAVIIAVSVMVSVSLCRAETLNFEVTVDRNRLAIGERLELGLVFHDTQAIPALELPRYDGMEWQYLGPSTMMSITNGAAESSITHLYSLVALKTGTYTIGPLQFNYEGNTYVSTTAVIEVFDRAQDTVGGSADRSSGIDDKLILVLVPAKRTAYLNEVVPVTVRLLASDLLLRDIAYPSLAQDGLFVAPYAPVKQYQQNIGGRVFDVVEFPTTLFALREGEFTLGPVSLSCSIMARKSPSSRSSSGGFADFFDSRIFEDFFGSYERFPVTVSSNAAELTVLPLPSENKPDGFEGAVGSFHFIAEAHPAEVKTGDPVTVRMTVAGSGNFNTVTQPRFIAGDGFKMYEPRVEAAEGSKLFEQVVIPMRDDIRELPGLSFSYFDPDRGSYETLSQGPFPLRVAKPQTEERLTFIEPSGIERVSRTEEAIGSDIIFIKQSPGRLSARGRLLCKNPLFAALFGVPVVLFIAAGMIVSRGRRLASDIRYARHLRAPRKARAGIKKAAALLAAGQTTLFYDELHQTLKGYLGDRFHLPSAGMTSSVVDETLQSKGIQQEALDAIRELFNECDTARYAPSALSRESMAASLRKLEECIDYLQRQGSASGTRARMLVLFAVMGVCACAGRVYAQEPDARDLFYQANARYQDGAYAEAAAVYEQIIARGRQSGPLYYNLGNSYVKLKEYGRAVLNYERARQVMPADNDLRANYRYLRRLLDLPEQGFCGTRAARLNEALWQAASADDIARGIFFLFVVLLAGVFAAVFLKKIGRRPWFAVLVFLTVCILVSAVWALNRRVAFLERAAVVIVQEASARFEPQAQATVHFTLSEGQLVQVIRYNDGWARVRRHDAKDGWVPKDVLEEL